jgi:hypothetical protein
MHMVTHPIVVPHLYGHPSYGQPSILSPIYKITHLYANPYIWLPIYEVTHQGGHTFVLSHIEGHPSIFLPIYVVTHRKA